MHSQQWRRLLKPRFKMAAACCAVLALAVAACSSSGGGGSPAPPDSGRSSGTKVTGGTATFALPPSSAPNYIFPFASSTYFSTVNFEEFQYMIFRPLYWFGNGASPTLNDEPEPGRSAGVQRQAGDDHHEGLEVVQRGDRQRQ